MRTLKELWQIALDNYDINQKHGICHYLYTIQEVDKITIRELENLLESFYNNKPTIFSRFYWNLSYLHPKDQFKKHERWWKFNQKGNIQRKKFMQHLVKKCSKQ